MEEYNRYSQGQLLKNRYSKVADLSEGSYGLVSVARDTKLDRLVAVKYIYPLDYKKKTSRASSSPVKLRVASKRSDTKQILKGLYEEAAKEISIHQILGTHANISALYDHFDSYLVLEYCSRGDLYEAIQNGQGPAKPNDIKDVFNQILNALEYCHSHGVYHRDLKPENILIGEDWSIKLCDWGLATTNLKITAREEFDVGSERYMAPELFDQELEFYDASKVDLWSVGIILLTLVFHKNPFQVANYSDKRFLQFVTNREALFDIFSTMTGEMFSVLRFCLNIDPDNRDLPSLKAEIMELNYFTIDDEFLGSDLDDYSEEDEEADEEAVVDDDDESLSQDEGESTFYLEDTDKSLSETPPKVVVEKADEIKSPRPEVPHKADALLSHTTSLEPIPISGNGRAKFFRNSRKPFSVASYQSQGQKYHHNNGHRHNINNNNYKFNREEFFTPKSVFNHYMNKYGESKAQPTAPVNRPTLKRKPSNWKKNNNKPRTYKKNYRNSWVKNNNKKFNNPGNGHTLNTPTQKVKSDFSNFNQHSHRRKSNSFSSTKAKNIIPVNSASGTSYHSFGHPSNMNPSQASNTSSTGKYVPPFMRSPNYNKSPLAAPLSEAIDNMSLNDYDEVFHLEDDFDLGDSGEDSQSSRYTNDTSFKKPAFKAPTYNAPLSNEHKNHHYFPYYSNSSNASSKRYSGTYENSRPHSMHVNDVSSMLASSTSGKYVPPFRRGSHSSSQANGNGKQDRRRENRKSHNDQFGETAVSAPSGRAEWLSYPKPWSDFDD